MAGLSCTPADVIRLALDDLRDRHPSPKSLDAALRRHMWRERRSPRRPPRARAPRRVEPAKVGVLVVHAHPTVRAGLARVLADDEEIEVVTEVDDAVSAARAVRATHPRVALVDVSMPGIDAIARIRPAVNVVVLADPGDRELVLAAVEAGAIGLLPRDAGPDALRDAVRAAARGESAGGLKAALALIGPGSPEPVLTARQRQVLGLVRRGLANKQIASQLGISEKTVKAHLSRTFQRIGAADRTQAALWAERDGIIGRS
ncbi:MAG TPA: response regulator transcription factor [Candidatus Dormibacteraeota bacterium]|nr:response regulator transcription factor [Candidatus Dormibacteraeota bacterium]